MDVGNGLGTFAFCVRRVWLKRQPYLCVLFVPVRLTNYVCVNAFVCSCTLWLVSLVCVCIRHSCLRVHMCGYGFAFVYCTGVCSGQFDWCGHDSVCTTFPSLVAYTLSLSARAARVSSCRAVAYLPLQLETNLKSDSQVHPFSFCVLTYGIALRYTPGSMSSSCA